MGIILGTGGDDCVDLCASLFCVCGRYGARAQKSRHTNDHSGGSRVLVAGIVMMSTVVGIEATTITQATATPTSMKQGQTLQLPPATEQTITPSAPFVPLGHTRRLIVGNWTKTRAKDLITGRRCSNYTHRGQLTIKSWG